MVNEPWCSSLTQNPPHLSPSHNLVLPSCLFQTSFFTLNVFIHFNRLFWSLPVGSFLCPPSVMQRNGTFQFPPQLSLLSPSLTVFSTHQLFVLSSCSLYSKKVLYREKNTELLFFLFLHVTKISVHRCRNSEETFPIGRFTAQETALV